MNDLDLSNKTLLMIGAGAYAQDIKSYKQEMGFKVITVGKYEEDPRLSFRDEHYCIDRTDVNGLINLVNSIGIDGIFVGSSEQYASVAIDVSERTNAKFYANRTQWAIMQNKAKFKKLFEMINFNTYASFSHIFRCFQS